jgi:tRNA(adenine34) deaminase
MQFTQEQQEHFVRLAMAEADKAIRIGSSPFGAVVVDENGEVLGADFNTVSSQTDMTCHAEINLIRKIAKEHSRRLVGCTVFINAASCSMCASAMIQAGARDFYYGAPFEPHTNPAVSYLALQQYCKEPLTIIEGILGEECKAQIERGRQAQLAKAAELSSV